MCKVVTLVQSTNSISALSKFHLSQLSVMPFSCKLLISNDMISFVIWFILALINFYETANYTRSTGLCNFCCLRKSYLTCAHFHQISLKITLLPIQNPLPISSIAI